MIVSISPVAVFPTQATKLLLYNFIAQPNSTLIAQYRLLDSSGNPLTVPTHISLTPDQYANWGNTDDNVYLPQCFAANLGLTLMSGTVT